MASYFEIQVQDRRKALAELERRKLVLEAELRAYEDAVRHERSALEHQTAPVSTLDVGDPNKRELFSSYERLTDHWREVLRALNKEPSFRSKDMYDAAHKQGMTTSMPNVRSQLTLLTQRGLLTRVGEGEYSIAETVAELLRSEAVKTNEAARFPATAPFRNPVVGDH